MRPTAGPARLEVELVGAPLDPADAARLSHVTLRQRLSMPAQLELVFSGADRDLADRALVMVGFSARLRADPDRSVLFEGDITAVEHGYQSDGELELRIRGYDPLHRLRKRQRVRSFADVDVADLAGELTGDLGLTVEAAERGPRRRQVVQWRQSDLALLTETAAAAGLYFEARAERLALFSLAGAGDALPLRLGDGLLDVELELNGDDAVESVTALGWDPATGRRFEERAEAARSGRTAGVRLPVADLGGDGHRTLPNVVAGDADLTRAAAQAGLDRSVAMHAVARGTAEGHAGLRPGAPIRLEGVALGFEGEYVVAETTHTFDPERGYLTAFATAPPVPAPAPPAGPLIAPGIVVRVDDPDDLGRVAVALPTLPTVETLWLRVLLPGVGNQAGLIALPAVDDEVLVLFPGGDPAGGIVLGGLFGADQAPDFGVVDGEIRRYTWRTRQGQLIALDDAERTIRVAIDNGSSLLLGPERLSIHSATDLEIAAPGRTIAIRAKAIDFEQADE